MDTLLSVYCLDCIWHHSNKERITLAYLFTNSTVALHIKIWTFIVKHILRAKSLHVVEYVLHFFMPAGGGKYSYSQQGTNVASDSRALTYSVYKYRLFSMILCL